MRVFKLGQEIGTVEVGKSASVLLMQENPLETISAYDTIETIIVGSGPFDRESLLLPD